MTVSLFCYRGLQEHDPAECDYQREYAAIIRDVVNGKIPETEEKVQIVGRAETEGRAGAAPTMTCADQGGSRSSFMDVACIWVSVLLVTILLVVFLSAEGGGLVLAF